MVGAGAFRPLVFIGVIHPGIIRVGYSGDIVPFIKLYFLLVAPFIGNNEVAAILDDCLNGYAIDGFLWAMGSNFYS